MSITGPMTCTTLPTFCAVAVCAITFVSRPHGRLHLRRAYGYVAAAPDTTSIISRVIAACRTLFMYNVKLSSISAELRVAASIAVICAAKKAAFDSSSARYTCTCTCRGSRSLKMTSGAGSYK